MIPIEIKPNIYWTGVNDRTTDLFEGLWPITQEGVSYNAYLIRDKKTALIDLSRSLKADDFFSQINQLLNIRDLDYVVMNHLEPDHAGVLRLLRQLAPKAKLLGTPKARAMLQSFYGVTDGVEVVEDGGTLFLGQHTLKFVHTPFVHWPETMMTYEMTERILFSCDGFGSYGALRGAIFDDQCSDQAFYEREALRYYANIVSVFSNPVLKAIDKLAGVPLAMIAPSHGLVWRKNPSRIVELYQKWANYATEPGKCGVTLLYASMYGNTEQMMNSVAQGISREGVPVEIFDVNRTHVSYILSSLWTQQGVMVGAPTYEGSLFPPMAYVLRMAAHKRVRNKLVARFGSYGWSGGAQRDFERLIEPLQWQLTDSLEFVGSPEDSELGQGENFGTQFARVLNAQ